jgi:hypothetical protein
MKTKSEQLRERVEASGRGRVRRYSPRLKKFENLIDQEPSLVILPSLEKRHG